MIAARKETTNVRLVVARSAKLPRWCLLYVLCDDTRSHCSTRTQEELQLRSREQDEQIRSLLSQFDRLRVEAKVTEWQRRASATHNVGGLVGESCIVLNTWKKAYHCLWTARRVCPVSCHYYSALIGPLQVDLSRKRKTLCLLP